MEVKRKNIPLIIALFIPVVMVVLIAASIYLPSFFVSPPQTDFVYSMGGDYYSRDKFTVKEGRVVENEVKLPENNYAPRYAKDPKLFYYDVTADSAREISLQEAQERTLNNQPLSSDGFEVVSGSYGGDMLFLSYDSSSRCKKYLKKGAFSRKLNLVFVEDYCYSFEFLGWAKED